MNNFIKKAVRTVVGNLVATKSGLLLPEPFIAGKHFGGFKGYEEWIQQCIASACNAARNVQPDELSELTALVMWVAEDQDLIVSFKRHVEVVRALEDYGDLLVERGLAEEGLTNKVIEQIRRADALRQQGTLLVVAVRWVNGATYKELRASTSAWNPSSLEEAKAVPKQSYTLA